MQSAPVTSYRPLIRRARPAVRVASALLPFAALVVASLDGLALFAAGLAFEAIAGIR